MFEPGTNQRPIFFHVDFHFRFSILFGHTLIDTGSNQKKRNYQENTKYIFNSYSSC